MNKIIITILLSLSFFLKIDACEECERVIKNLEHLIETLPNIIDKSKKDNPGHDAYARGIEFGLKYGLEIAVNLIHEQHPVMKLHHAIDKQRKERDAKGLR